MVCHCSHRAIDSSEPSEKNWTSLSSNKLCNTLYATRPSLPWAQVLTLTEVGSGSPLSVKVGCQLGVARDKEATSALP